MKNPFKILDNAAFVLNLVVRKLEVKVSSFTVEREVMLHPSYPSLLAYSDCLNSWKVPNEAFQVDKKTFNIGELEGGFVAHVKTLGGQFVWVDNISVGKITYSDHKSSAVIVSQDEFYQMWDGIILFAEKDKESGEENYRSSLMKGWLDFLRLPLLVTLFLSTIFLCLSLGQSTSYYLLILLKLAGIVVSFILLMHSVNSANPFIQNLCGLGDNNDCNAILKSEAAKVTSWLTWSEVGMLYFAGSFIALLINPSNIVYVAYINILALPYTFYSIGYQIKAKTWCILCCTVQAILWLEAFSFFSYRQVAYDSSNLFDSNFLSIVLCCLVPIGIWSFLKPFFLKAAQLMATSQQLSRYKYDSGLFQKSLQSQPKYPVGTELKPLTIGNNNAANVITMVSNPFCNPCGSAHKTIEEWLDLRNDIQLKVVFLTGNHPDDPRTIVAGHVSALMLNKGAENAKLALGDWYRSTEKNIEAWKHRYPLGEKVLTEDIMENQKQWCSMADIAFTPTIFVNGYKLPHPYRLEDLKYLLE